MAHNCVMYRGSAVIYCLTCDKSTTKHSTQPRRLYLKRTKTAVAGSNGHVSGSLVEQGRGTITMRMSMRSRRQFWPQIGIVRHHQCPVINLSGCVGWAHCCEELPAARGIGETFGLKPHLVHHLQRRWLQILSPATPKTALPSPVLCTGAFSTERYSTPANVCPHAFRLARTHLHGAPICLDVVIRIFGWFVWAMLCVSRFPLSALPRFRLTRA